MGQQQQKHKQQQQQQQDNVVTRTQFFLPGDIKWRCCCDAWCPGTLFCCRHRSEKVQLGLLKTGCSFQQAFRSCHWALQKMHQPSSQTALTFPPCRIMTSELQAAQAPLCFVPSERSM